MDFRELLNVADHNKSEASHEVSIKRFTTELPPPKKVSRHGVESDNIAKFLAKRKAEKAAKDAEARKQKEKLLALRAQNTKNSKKAKIMASRTKDNDFSKIKLTDDEVQARKKREEELLLQNLSNKVERMKARIVLEEKEKLLPKKRKRKSKNEECIESHDNHDLTEGKKVYQDSQDMRNDKNSLVKNNISHKASKPMAPTISFTELLKVAEKKQFEPVEIIPKKKEEEKPMTKKEKKLLIEERERERRKKERLLMGESGTLKPCGVSKTSSKTASMCGKKNVTKGNPVVIHIEKDHSKQLDSNKSKISKNAANIPLSKSQLKSKESTGTTNMNKSAVNRPNMNIHLKNHFSEHKSAKSLNAETPEMLAKGIKKSVSKNGEIKMNSVSTVLPKPHVPQIDEDAISASIEKKIREKIEKELEQKLLSKFGLLNGAQPNKSSVSQATSKPIHTKKESLALNEDNRKHLNKLPIHSKKDIERLIAMKKQAMKEKKLTSKPPEKKPFHFNPYLDPPRRLLEPQIRRPPPQRRVESSDEEDDDDLSDFIDDGPTTQNEENYSQYIKEIFGYDKNKYMDDDDDGGEAMESSFAQQMKEEIESAKAGIREDLEEERKEIERRKRKKLKKK